MFARFWKRFVASDRSSGSEMPGERLAMPDEAPIYPATLIVCRGKRLSYNEYNELKHIHALGIHYREQMEASAARCCEILGIDPEIDSVDRDFASDIVFNGTNPKDAITHLNQSQSRRRQQS